MIRQQRPNGSPDTDDTDPVARLRLQFDELQTYVGQQLAARIDRALLGLRRMALLAFVGAAALVAVLAWIVTAVVLFLFGASEGLATLFAGRIWLANLIVGATALGLVAVAAMVSSAAWAATSKRRTKIKYQHRERDQQRRFG